MAWSTLTESERDPPRMSPESCSLTIVIPALNEESAIGETIHRCLGARELIRSESGVTDIEIIVVSDGSSDKTEAIAEDFDEVTVLAFHENRGYGAAIQCGFDYGQGSLLGFIDADGTCDPRAFGTLCRAILTRNADVVLGSRVGPGNRMPWVRAVGNALFAWLLGFLSKQHIRDTASGMRVLRRSALDSLYPLPDGLHFTPAMTARILLENKLRLVEVPIDYAERIGQSKLSVANDGVRFLATIIQAAMCYRPARLLLVVATILGFLALATGTVPAWHYLQYGYLEEWMIYRVLLASLLITVSGFVVCTAVAADRVAAVAHCRSFGVMGVTARLSRLFSGRLRRLVSATLLIAAVVVVLPGITEFFSTGHVTMHWSRAVLASQLVLLSALQVLTAVTLDMVNLIERQRNVHRETVRPDRARNALVQGS